MPSLLSWLGEQVRASIPPWVPVSQPGMFVPTKMVRRFKSGLVMEREATPEEIAEYVRNEAY